MDAPGKWNVGDLAHVLEVAILLISIGANYARFVQIETDVAEHTRALQRIEHYLASRDAEYWRKAVENGDSAR
jgi:hypothetical protein